MIYRNGHIKGFIRDTDKIWITRNGEKYSHFLLGIFIFFTIDAQYEQLLIQKLE